MQPNTLAWLLILLPAIAVHGALLISSSAGLIPWCFPYLDGEVSISRAARNGNALFLFRGIMIFTAALLCIFWLYAYRWLVLLGDEARRARYWMRLLGVVGALFLVLYADFLGTDGRMYRFMRQFGVTFYFSFTVLAQMILSARLKRLCRAGLHGHLYPSVRLMVANCGILLAIGLSSLAVSLFMEERDAAENIIEWWFALFMTLYFGLAALAWRRDGLRWSCERGASAAA